MDRSMMPVAPPFGAPPPGMGMPGMAPPPADPVALVSAMRSLMPAIVKPPEPIYRPGYKPPKAPSTERVIEVGKRLYDNNQLWRFSIYTILRWSHQELTGMFPEDQRERDLGFQEEYISTALSDERNLIISTLANLNFGVRAQRARDENRGYAQRLEDFVRYLREEERFSSPDGGQRPLEIDEGALFVDYGMYVSRDTFNPNNPNCPVDMTLIDPTQVYPVWDRRTGLREVYRVYRDTTAEITAAYGDFSASQMAKLKNEIGQVEDDTEHEVIEWWDTWQRKVIVNGQLILSAEHKYGDVPYTIQYGGMGIPMFARMPVSGMGERRNNRWEAVNGTRNDERVRQAVPYLFYRIRSHEIYEAVMARILTGFKKDINPPTIRYRSDAAAEKPMPGLDASPGAQNEAMLGEEKIEAFPTTNMATTDRVITQLTQDRMTGSAPPSMFGRLQGTSNVTGVAQQEASDAGMHLLIPMVKAWEAGLARRYDRIARMVGNFGHLAAYGSADEPKPFMIPVSRRPKRGDPAAYEFDREVIEKAGSRVIIDLRNIANQNSPAEAAAAKNRIDAGLTLRREERERLTGDTDEARFYDEYAEEQGLFAALQLPEYQKFKVYTDFIAEAKENEGKPEYQKKFLDAAELWKQTVLAPQPQQPPMGGPPGMAPQGPPQATPGVPGGMSYPAMGQGPGSMGAPVGRPDLQGSDVGP